MNRLNFESRDHVQVLLHHPGYSLSVRLPVRSLPLFLLLASAAATAARAGEPAAVQAKLGPVQADLRLEPAEPLIGDPVTLTLRVVAEKGVELLMPEFGEALDQFTILDFVPRQEIDDQGRTVATQTYRLQPPFVGPAGDPTDPDRIRGPPPGRASGAGGSGRIRTYDRASRVRGEVGSAPRRQGRLEASPGKARPSSAASAAPLALGGRAVRAAGGRRGSRRPGFFSLAAPARRRSAYDIALSRLERLLASQRPDAEHIDAFYVELSGIVRRYLEDRFELRAPELTTEEFLETVQQAPDLSRDHQVLLREFLRQADLVKFAGMKPAEEDVNRSVTAAKRFLDETRENAPWIDLAPDLPEGDTLEHAGERRRRSPAVGDWEFRDPLFLSLALLSPLAYFLAKRAPAVVGFSSLNLLQAAPRSLRSRLTRLPALLLAAAVLLLAIGAARPRTPDAQTKVSREGISIMMVVDRSGSMQARDLVPEDLSVDRLTVVKQVFRRFVLGGEDAGRAGPTIASAWWRLRATPTVSVR